MIDRQGASFIGLPLERDALWPKSVGRCQRISAGFRYKDVEGAKAKTDESIQSSAARTEGLCAAAPLPPPLAWEAEALFVRIFEYTDYSLRAALSGSYSEHLDCVFTFARDEGRLIGVGGALCGRQNPAMAILGPIGVLETHRRQGVGTALVTSLLRCLRDRGCQVVYLGVSSGRAALGLYERLGFITHKGIVRRLFLGSQDNWEQAHFAPSNDWCIRRANWGDFPGVQVLLSHPCCMMTVDLSRGIFSSRYLEPTRFLGVFPEIMRTCQRQGGAVNVLVTRATRSVVGLAHVCRLPGRGRRHVAQLEFYVHDNHVDQAGSLVGATMRDARGLRVRTVRTSFLDCDTLKRRVVERLGGIHVATFNASALLDGTFEAIVVYQWNLDAQ